MFDRLAVLMLSGCCLCACSSGLAGQAAAEPKVTNYDEARVPKFELPDALLTQSGQRVADAATWQNVRRPELLRLFAENEYGRTPDIATRPTFKLRSTDSQALGGRAMRKQVTVYLTGSSDGPSMELLVYVPNGAGGPVPAFLGLNFGGNQAVANDPGIEISTRWMRQDRKSASAVVDHRATEASRGIEASRWQVEKVIGHGYALATVYYGDLEPDSAEGWKQGIRAALSPQGANTEWAPDAWGAISAWAWGLSRAMDYLEQDPSIDARHVALLGHSRLGKTALWAGAQDPRFAIVISNDSGEGGAALARRQFGERIENLVTSFPHWFCLNYRRYAGHEDQLPIDQHELIALIAPRPVYLASATEDRWADPRGEFLSALAADPVYRLFGLVGLGVDQMPPPDHPVGDFVGYHLRTGKHDVAAYDWDQYLRFADRHFKKR
ncbi:MAG TPA: acetylxylan esterase [Pirellulales bacterium]|nr:acetylxylan esterase [Pirellulales bacterium]